MHRREAALGQVRPGELEERRRDEHEDAHHRARQQALGHPDDREVGQHRGHDPKLARKALEQHIEHVNPDRIALVGRPGPGECDEYHRQRFLPIH